MGATMGKNGNLLDALPSQSTMHVVMLGLDSAGKTTALYRLKFDQYLNTVPTIGFNCEKIQGTIGKAKNVQFLVWDVGGQEKLRPLWRSYTRCTDGILFVVDSVDVERMEEAKMELMRTAKCPDNQGVPVLILANKQDLPNARDPKDLERLLGLHELQYPAISLSATSSSTGNIVGCSQNVTSQSGSNSNSQKRCLPPNASHKPKSFEFSGGVSCDMISSSTIMSTQSFNDQRLAAVNDESFSRTTDVNTTATPLATTPTIAASGSIQTAYPTKKHASTTTAADRSNLQFKGWYIQPACAITGEGLQEGLQALHDMILKRRKLNKAYKKKR